VFAGYKDLVPIPPCPKHPILLPLRLSNVISFLQDINKIHTTFSIINTTFMSFGLSKNLFTMTLTYYESLMDSVIKHFLEVKEYYVAVN
jgi:hypothetical protein